MMTDPGFPSLASNLAPSVVTAEAFLGLTNQVQALASVVQTIVPYLPQLIQSATQQSALPVTFPRMESPVAPNRETQLEAEPPQRQAAEAHAASPTVAPARSQSRSCNPNEVLKSKGEIGESSKGTSPFTLNIQGKPLPATFRLPTLELYDGSSDPTKHITAFCAQMALYDTSDALMRQAFPTTLRGLARTWYSCLKPASISSFDLLAKEFESNFLVSACPKLTTASLLGLVQGSEESLSQFVGRFTSQVQGILDLHPSLAIQTFLTEPRPSRFFWSLIERPLQCYLRCYSGRTNTWQAETLVTSKRDESKRPRAEQPRGHPPAPPKRREDRSGMLSSRPPRFPSTRLK
ncbi:hypothetical protein B296_00037302 [Ensete ventricosum]|uniref:Retrotransposon gag domain-containing protein n=1 Tax=Ensete ventricosum TaxID=4639 RepID=A0A426XMJ2_ENSVE|nr:hypothetical protein B296_00037302 [Ensete ventricosum]